MILFTDANGMSGDGVWLECECGWSFNLDDKATPNHAVIVANNHLTSDEHEAMMSEVAAKAEGSAQPNFESH